MYGALQRYAPDSGIVFLMLNNINSSALASLAIAEAMTPDPAPKAIPAPKACECSDCYGFELAGFTVPTGPLVTCGAEVLIRDRAQRWALVADWEADREYAIRRAQRYTDPTYWDEPEQTPEELREETIERFLQAA
jgi:hypothetical protein